jgi:lipopolysaccharide transport system permease protein
LNIEAYPGFVFVALLPFLWFSTCLGSAGLLFIANRDLVRRPDFLPSMLITVNTLSNLVNFLIFFPILFLMLAIYGRPMSLALLILPLLFLIQGILIGGLSLIIAILNVFYRDIQHITALGLTVLFYMIPIFYEIQSIDKSYDMLFILNPVAVLVIAYRYVFFYGRIPGLGSLLFAGLASVAALGLGYFIYRRQLHDVIDYI